MSKESIFSFQKEISSDQQVLINKTKGEAWIDPRGTNFAGKGNLSMDAHKDCIKKVMSHYKPGLW